jgi:multidrug efflux system outer membrane protein
MSRHRMGPLGAVALVVLAGCALPPAGKTSPPTLEVPQTTVPTVSVAVDWWTAFNDPVLTTLVTEALQNNSELGRALARIDEARALLRLAGADRLPSVYATASGRREGRSETGSQTNGPSVSSTYRLAAGVDYELDLWSRLARTDDAARAELLSASTTRDGLYGVVAVQVIQAYTSLQSLDAQLQLFTSSVRAQRDSLRLQQLRHVAGDIGELDLRQLDAELATNEAQLPRIERARGESERALALLVGRSPRAVIEQAIARAPQPQMPAVPDVPADLPSDLLQHRPDVRAAQARLAAAGARVDAARAAYFPSIKLTATLGQESAELSKLFDGPSLIWSLVASATQPIWGAGRLEAQSEAARARERIAEIDYRDSVAAAFKDARDTLGARGESAEGLRLAQQRSVALARAAELTRLRYEGGESSRLQLIEAERASLAAQASLADARRALVVAQADVYRALGGGWRETDTPAR